MREHKYILRGREAVPEPDLRKWGIWFETNDRRVARTERDDVAVSTVFLGIDYSHGYGPPLLFETMVFGGPLDQQQDRCSTYDQAEAMHKRWCDQAFGNNVVGFRQ